MLNPMASMSSHVSAVPGRALTEHGHGLLQFGDAQFQRVDTVVYAYRSALGLASGRGNAPVDFPGKRVAPQGQPAIDLQHLAGDEALVGCEP